MGPLNMFGPFGKENNLFCFLGMELQLLGTAVQSLVTIPNLLSGLRLYMCFPICFRGLNRRKFTLSRLK